MLKLFILILFFNLSLKAQEMTPTERVTQSLSFSDDLNFRELSTAIKRQLLHYQRMGLKGRIKFGEEFYPKIVLKASLLQLQKSVAEAIECQRAQTIEVCADEFTRELNQKFAIYRPVPGKEERGFKTNQTFYTAYYTPDFEGSRTPDSTYKNPIYALPSTPSDRTLTRVEIDFDHRLRGKGLELLWVKETLFDIWLLHVQGGGRVNMADGSKTYLSFNGKNGHQLQWISKYLLDNKLISADKLSYAIQRDFLEAHPEHQRPAYATSPSYVFFKETNDEPYGLDEIPLTAGRSLAWDNTVYKTLGVINFITAAKTTHYQNGYPVKKPFSRFFLAQDTGSAIRGNARCDLYWGYGEEALAVASKMMELGEQYFLILKEDIL